MISEEGLWNGRGYELLFFASFVEEEEQSLNVEGGASLSGASEDVPKTGKFAFS